MTLVNERTTQEVFEFSNGSMSVVHIDIEEYKTVWRLSAKFSDWALPVAQGWTYKKSEYKTERNAVTQLLRTLHERY